jgi:hypothetical protein
MRLWLLARPARAGSGSCRGECDECGEQGARGEQGASGERGAAPGLRRCSRVCRSMHLADSPGRVMTFPPERSVRADGPSHWFRDGTAAKPGIAFVKIAALWRAVPVRRLCGKRLQPRHRGRREPSTGAAMILADLQLRDLTPTRRPGRAACRASPRRGSSGVEWGKWNWLPTEDFPSSAGPTRHTTTRIPSLTARQPITQNAPETRLFANACGQALMKPGP